MDATNKKPHHQPPGSLPEGTPGNGAAPNGAPAGGQRRSPSSGRPGARLNLPFEPQGKQDAASWIYRNRVGLLVTVVIYLVAAIVFLSYRIAIGDDPSRTMYVDLVDPEMLARLEQLKQLEEQKLQALQDQSSGPVRNLQSNENAQLNPNIRDDRSSRASEIYQESDRVQQQLAAGQQAYRDGMAEIEAMGANARGARNNTQSPAQSQRPNATSDSGGAQGNVRVQGNVTVSYNLPGRSAVYLHVPAYQCENAGKVVVGIRVNRNGQVAKAWVASSTAGSENCIQDMAVKAALASSFNVDSSAANPQEGTITYIFVAQ